MNQRGGAPPIFIRSIGEKNLRHDFVSHSAIKQPARSSCERILLGLIGEGKNIGREENGRSRLCVARWLSESVIEAAAARSCHVGQNAVKRDPSLFVGVETLIEKVAQEPSILRNAFAI